MKSRNYSKIIITTSIIVFALIVAVEPTGLTSVTIFENVLAAQEGAIIPEGMNNIMSTIENATEGTSNATLASVQGEEGQDISGMKERFENDTTGIPEGQVDPDSKGEVDLGTGGS